MKRLFAAIIAIFFSMSAQAQFLSTPLNQLEISSQTSADSVSNFVFSAPLKGLYSLTVKTAGAGYIMVFDATVFPSNGAITSCTSYATARPCLMYCFPVAAAGSTSIQWASPLFVSSGVVAGFSSTGCDSITASTTAKFMGQTL